MKMRNTILYIFVCLLLISCDKEEVSGGTYMDVKTCIDSASGKALTSPIWMLILDKDENAYYNTESRILSYSANNKWLFNEAVKMRENGDSAYVYAYYPYDNSHSHIKNVNVADQIDIMYSKSTYKFDQHPISISFNHILTKIIVSVSRKTVQNLSLFAPNSAKFDVLTGKLSFTSLGEVFSSNSELLILPHVINNADLKIRIDNKLYTYSLKNKNFISGEKYVFNFIIDETKDILKLSSLSVEDWKDQKPYEDYL